MDVPAGRRKLLVANWKMNFLRAQVLRYLQILKEHALSLDSMEIVLAPPFTLLETVGRELEDTKLKLAAQNLFYEREGAFTGEISPLMLKDLRCSYVIVGHSERRRLLGETNEIVNKKLRAALEADLVPILCVGESLAEHQIRQTETILEAQVCGALHGLKLSLGERLVIAYEPVWAIGTGVNAEPSEAEASAGFIRGLISKLHGPKMAQAVRILYGGSVKPRNVQRFLAQSNMNGALVGGASLDPVAFTQMAKLAENSIENLTS